MKLKQKKQKEHLNPWQEIKALVRQPDKGFYRQPILHINCYGQIEIENCKEILRYNEQEICLDMGLWTVSLFGDSLELCNASKGQLLLRGRVFRTEFSYGKAEEK